MTDLIKKGALFLMSPKCYDNYFLEFNFFDVPCFKALLSKGLGLGIIAGSLLVKVPQVLKILSNKSGEGINLVGVLLDLLAISFHMSYSYMNGYPFSAWGDNTFLALQTVAIAALVLLYSGRKSLAIAFIGAYASLLYILNSGLTPMKVLLTIQSLNIPILLVGKLSQALTNYRNGSTGQLSAATVIMLFAGSLARIFTSIQETGDQMMIITFCASSFANGVILAQLIYYWNKEPASTLKKDAAKPKKAKSKKDD
ncbi:mannose-P-dolichol utilization defect 1 protein homolog [Scaptodrosophila lebanonensis]|uniref:Mannose-P-dolichol utilization defect 1 protein homolog n=1 Tax=Drosophila lebanonensis TaxID=7225 RepID=A0A6J2U8Q8_DROLE|nr:mannose-P-dolichol utilization defect 1 protein homolog [Scaptodrosophila lebanonensis]